jgi:hypothetical protein
MGFADSVVEKLEGFLEDPYENESRILGLLEIIPMAVKNPLIRNDFHKGSVVKYLSSDQEFSPTLENARWNAVMAVFSQSDVMKFGTLAIRAHSVLVKVWPRVHSFHAITLSFLIEFFDIRKDLFDENLFRGILGLMLQFSGASLFHMEARRFIVASLKDDVIAERVIKIFVPVLMAESQFKDHGVLHVYSFAILEDILNKSKWNLSLNAKLRQVEGFTEFISRALKPWKKSCEGNYGGDSSRSWLSAFWQSFFI